MKVIQRSFTAGEITPELHGRPDLPIYGSALAQAENFLPLPHGPASYRPGFEYIQQAKYSDRKCRLLEFVFNADQQYILEFGHEYVRFHTDGGTVLEASKNITGITQATPGVVTSTAHGYSNGDWIYLSGITGMTELNGRYFIVAGATANTFTLTTLHGDALSTASYTAYTSGGTASRVYEVATDYQEAELFDVSYSQSNDVITLVHDLHPPRQLSRTGAATWIYADISFGSVAVAPTGLSIGQVGTGTTTYTYVVTTLVGDINEESVASAEVSTTNNLITAGNKNTISWSAPAAYKRFRVYKDDNGLFGYIGSTDALSFTDQNILADVTQTPPEDNQPFGGSGDYPGAVGYRGQRKVFAGTINDPQKFWMTKPGTEANLNRSIPVQDDDSVIATLSSQNQNRVLHIVNDEETILLTNGGVWKITGDGGTALSPSTVSARKQRAPAAARLRPLDVDDAILYTQQGKNRVIDLIYSWEANTYAGQDVSVFALHLLNGYTLDDWAAVKVPYNFVWAVRSDGALLCLSYLRQQEVTGWTKHSSTNGLFESVAAIQEENEDRLYAVVKRTINGTARRYIERMKTLRFTSDIEQAFYVDSGLSYSGTSTTTISGLDHLEGQTLTVLADGSQQPNVTVTNGSVTLQEAAEVVHLGLGYTGTLRSLPVAFQIEALGQGRVKNVNRVYIRFVNSRGAFAGPSLDRMTEIKQRTTEGYGVATALTSDEHEIPIYGDWTRGGQVYIQQSAPLPCTVSAVILELQIGN